MTRKNILHMLTPLRHMSPFDVNMALDAGFDAVIPYTDVELSDIAGLVQDAIFSRPPDAGVDTGIFIAGRNVIQALDMTEAAGKARVPPFTLNIFADPAGSFTTAAAMVAKVEKALVQRFGRKLSDTRVSVFGATGVVGFCSAVIAAGEGARVTLVGHDGTKRVGAIAGEIEKRFNSKVAVADGSNEDRQSKILSDTEIILCAAKAGVQVLSLDQLRNAPDLLIAADVNAVPPAGVEGVAVNADAVPIEEIKALGIGPLAIGNVKYKTQAGLFRKMIEAEKAVTFDFRDAFSLARAIAK